MDTIEIVGIVLTLLFGAAALTYGGYSMKAEYPLRAILSYVIAGGCVAAALIIPIVTAIYGLPSKESTALTTISPAAPVAALPSETSQAGPSPITSEREGGCEFVNVSPKYLVELLVKNTSVQGHHLMQGYIGKCLKMAGDVVNVNAFNDKRSVVTFSYFDPHPKNGPDFYAVNWWFAPDWADRTAALSKGTHIVVEGRIRAVDMINVDLDHCKFLPAP